MRRPVKVAGRPIGFSRLRCVRTMRVLQSYLDGQLDDVATERIAAHLETCRRCGLEASMYSEIKQALRDHHGAIDSRLLDRLREFAVQLASGDPSGGDGDG
jgi:anti-sigma factor RsiW